MDQIQIDRETLIKIERLIYAIRKISGREWVYWCQMDDVHQALAMVEGVIEQLINGWAVVVPDPQDVLKPNQR